MKPTRQPVEPIDGEPFRFHVRSRSRQDIRHLVDVEENRCSCEHAEFRVNPHLNKGESAARCWHLQMARDFLLDNLIEKLKYKT